MAGDNQIGELAAAAMACAAMLSDPATVEKAVASGHNLMPKVTVSDEWLLPMEGQTDRYGRHLPTSNGSAQYRWGLAGAGEITAGEHAGFAQIAHEMGHRLQNLAGMHPGLPNTDQRRMIEAQAYDIERRAPFECLTPWGDPDPQKLRPGFDLLRR